MRLYNDKTYPRKADVHLVVVIGVEVSQVNGRTQMQTQEELAEPGWWKGSNWVNRIVGIPVVRLRFYAP